MGGMDGQGRDGVMMCGVPGLAVHSIEDLAAFLAVHSIEDLAAFLTVSLTTSPYMYIVILRVQPPSHPDPMPSPSLNHVSASMHASSPPSMQVSTPL